MAKTKKTKTGRKAASGAKAPARKRPRGSTPRPPSTRTDRIRALATRGPGKLIGKLESIQDALTRELGKQVRLDMTTPKTTGRTPWAIVGRFSNIGVDYMTLAETIGKLEGELIGKLGRRRLSRMKVTYRGVKRKGRRERTRREWTLGEITSLDTLIPRAQNALIDAWADYGPGGRSLAEGASPSAAVEFEIWLSNEDANDTGDF